MTVWSQASIRELERDSLHAFVSSCSHLLTGKVLDFGAGRQPYRHIVEAAGGEYVAYDRAEFPANVSGEDVGPAHYLWHDWDAVLCTQVLQYLPDFPEVLGGFHDLLQGGQPGALILTGNVLWPEVESEDRCRYTQAGIEALLLETGFRDVEVVPRAGIGVGDLHLSIGWGAIGYAR